jgi:hypothetical protein
MGFVAWARWPLTEDERVDAEQVHLHVPHRITYPGVRCERLTNGHRLAQLTFPVTRRARRRAGAR